MVFLSVVKALSARGLFAVHTFVAVWRVVDIKEGDSSYWLLTCSIGLIVAEGLLSICSRGGREAKWFCPSVFFYLCCIIPPTWIMELDLAQVRIRLHSRSETADNNTNIGVSPKGSERPSRFPGLPLAINLDLSAELWAKILEQCLLVNLILGRWLLPKGDLTRGQLSQLLLVYIGMAADIVELFEAFKEEVVSRSIRLTCTVLFLWSWSLMQFTLVLTATKARKPRLGVDNSGSSALDVDRDQRPASVSHNCKNWSRFCSLDTWAIVTTIIFQDGPFLSLRLMLIFKYNVMSYLNIFFTAKNSLVLLLQLYRIIVLSCEKGYRNDSDHRPSKLRTHSNNIKSRTTGQGHRDFRAFGKKFHKPNDKQLELNLHYGFAKGLRPLNRNEEKKDDNSRPYELDSWPIRNSNRNKNRGNQLASRFTRCNSSCPRRAPLPGSHGNIFPGASPNSVIVVCSHSHDAPWSGVSLSLTEQDQTGSAQRTTDLQSVVNTGTNIQIQWNSYMHANRKFADLPLHENGMVNKIEPNHETTEATARMLHEFPKFQCSSTKL